MKVGPVGLHLSADVKTHQIRSGGRTKGQREREGGAGRERGGELERGSWQKSDGMLPVGALHGVGFAGTSNTVAKHGDLNSIAVCTPPRSVGPDLRHRYV